MKTNQLLVLGGVVLILLYFSRQTNAQENGNNTGGSNTGGSSSGGSGASGQFTTDEPSAKIPDNIWCQLDESNKNAIIAEPTDEDLLPPVERPRNSLPPYYATAENPFNDAKNYFLTGKKE